MRLGRAAVVPIAALLIITAEASPRGAVAQDAAASLAGTSWELVKFQGGDDKTLTPDDKSKYTLAFGSDGTISVRLDCNRGRGTWKSMGPNQLQLGPLALTRAMCPPGSLHDQIAKNWEYVRSYTRKDGHLYLSLMADSGTYEFEPSVAGATAGAVAGRGTDAPPQTTTVTSRGPFAFSCTAKSGGAVAALKITYYDTQPGLALIEFKKVTRPVFQTLSGSGAKYESKGVMYWEHQGEAALTWSGSDYICKRSGSN
jgi:heat shock protein HslJ/membrane-bound inhibitor of C-type lysozyme